MRQLWRAALDSVTPYEAGKPLEEISRELGQGEVVRLSANENPLGPSPAVVEAIRHEAAKAHLYPDGGASALRAALGRQLGLSADWLMVGNGADELLGLIARAAFEPGDEIVMPHPAFDPYGTETAIAGAAAVQSPLAGYETDLDDMLRRVTPRTKAIFICTPHNPATTMVRGSHLTRFIRALGGDPPLLIVDEAYRDFYDEPDAPDGVPLVKEYPTAIALRTFSKIAGLAGLRVGYAIARPETIERLNRVRAPYNVNRFAQAAALAALGDPAHFDRTRAVVLAERPRLSTAFEARGATLPRSQANFLLVKLGERADALRSALLKSGILVRDGAAVGFPGHLRISIGTPEQNNRLLEIWDGGAAPG